MSNENLVAEARAYVDEANTEPRWPGTMFRFLVGLLAALDAQVAEIAGLREAIEFALEWEKGLPKSGPVDLGDRAAFGTALSSVLAGKTSSAPPLSAPPSADMNERADALVIEIAQLEIVNGREVGSDARVVVGPKTRACVVRALQQYGDEREAAAKAELASPPDADVTDPRDLWRDLCEKDDRTSPEEYPDMALITEDELVSLLQQYGDERAREAMGEAFRAAEVSKMNAVREARAAAIEEVGAVLSRLVVAHRARPGTWAAGVLNEAITAIRALAPKAGPEWRHKKRGTTYVERDRGELQLATDHVLKEGDRLVSYRGEDGRTWFRHEPEFEDGRFEKIEP